MIERVGELYVAVCDSCGKRLDAKETYTEAQWEMHKSEWHANRERQTCVTCGDKIKKE